MAMKRYRSSSSFGSSTEDCTAAAGSSDESRSMVRRDSGKKSLKQSVMASDDSGGSRVGIFTISSPPDPATPVKQGKKEIGASSGGSGSGGGGIEVAFYEKCALCAKKIDSDENVYMYSYLQAYCSPICRDRQIFMDTKMKIVSQLLKATKPQPEPSSPDTHNVIRLFGVQITVADSAQQSSHVKCSSTNQV